MLKEICAKFCLKIVFFKVIFCHLCQGKMIKRLLETMAWLGEKQQENEKFEKISYEFSRSLKIRPIIVDILSFENLRLIGKHLENLDLNP